MATKERRTDMGEGSRGVEREAHKDLEATKRRGRGKMNSVNLPLLGQRAPRPRQSVFRQRHQEARRDSD